jgi:hypothetical protein
MTSMIEDAILFTGAAGLTIWLFVRIMNRRENWAIAAGVAWLMTLSVGWLRTAIIDYIDRSS